MADKDVYDGPCVNLAIGVNIAADRKVALEKACDTTWSALGGPRVAR